MSHGIELYRIKTCLKQLTARYLIYISPQSKSLTDIVEENDKYVLHISFVICFKIYNGINIKYIQYDTTP